MDHEEDFTDFVSARWPRLVRAAILLGCSPPEAEDLVQVTLERCLSRWGRVRQAQDRDAYVYRALVNGFVSARRRRWVGERPTLSPPDRVVPDETDQVAVGDAVRRALRRLPHDQRAVVVLRYYAHLSEQQAAAVLGVAPGTVKSRLSRALAVLSTDPQLAELRGSP